MRRTAVLALAFMALCPILAAAGSEAGVSALKIINKSFDPATQRLSYELWNRSSRPITAWRLSLAYGDGLGRAQRSVLDQDFFMQRQGDRRGLAQDLSSELRARVLAPGDLLDATWRLDLAEQPPGPAALSLAVAAVIFDDLSFAGDPEAAETILDARTARLEAIAGLMGELASERRRPRSRPQWQATLEQRAQALRRQAEVSAVAADARREVAAQLSTTRLELAEWLEAAADAIALAVDPGEELDRWTAALSEQLEAGREALRVGDGLSMLPEAGQGGER